MASWRARATAAIRQSLATTKGRPVDERIAALDAAYPFGPRRMYPYKIWRVERRLAIDGLTGRTPPPSCPACGVKGDKPCVPLADEIAIGGRHLSRTPRHAAATAAETSTP